MKKRTLSLALFLALLLTACGGDTKPSETTAPTDGTTAPGSEVETAPLTDGLEDRDMDGFTLSILHHNDEGMTWTVTQLDAEAQNGEIINDAIYNRNEKVKDRFNCDISITGQNSVNAAAVSQLIMSGDTTYDIIMQRDYGISSTAQYLMDWQELPHIKLDADWWYPEASNVFRFGDKLIAAANSISLSCVSRASGFAFNKAIYDEIESNKPIFDYIYEDNWTLDTFGKLGKAAYKDLNGDGSIDKDDRFGLGQSSYKETVARLVNGAGIDFVSRDNDGYPTFTLDTNEIALDKLMSIYKLYSDPAFYSNPNKSNADAAEAWGDITKGTALFRLCHSRAMGTTLRDANIDYGFVPNPKFDDKQDRYYSTTWAFEIMTLPRTLATERYDNVGMILEALSFDSHKNVLEPYKEDAVKIKYAQDEDSLKMLDIAFKSMSFDLGIVLWESSIVNPMILNIFTGDGSIVSTLTSMKNTIDSTLETFIESLDE